MFFLRACLLHSPEARTAAPPLPNVDAAWSRLICRGVLFFPGVFHVVSEPTHPPVQPRPAPPRPPTRRPGELPEELMMLDCLALLDLKNNKLVGELVEPAYIGLFRLEAGSKKNLVKSANAFVQKKTTNVRRVKNRFSDPCLSV